MKDFVRQAQSFITFEAPLEFGSIKTLFAVTHQQRQNKNPEWDVKSTRQQLIAHYWLNQVLRHFILLLTLPLLVFLLINGIIDHGLLLVIVLVAGLSFGVLLLFHYWPGFIRDFLPNLEAVINGFRQDQLSMIIAHQQEKIAQQEQEIGWLKEFMAVEEDYHQKALEKCKKEVVITSYRVSLRRSTSFCCHVVSLH